MRIRRPSPAMAVACTALFVSLGGTSVAAVNYARNAGQVDGKDAVAASSTLRRAAGDVVATNRRGPDRGQLPAKFVDDVARTTPFAGAYDVQDQAPAVPVPLLAEAGFATLTATCNDQDARAGVEDPITALSLANTGPGALNLSRRQSSVEGAVIAPLAPGTLSTATIGGSSTFDFHVQRGDGTQWFVMGTVRQDGRGTADAKCLVVGTAVRVEPA